MTSPLKSFGPKRPARARDAGVGRLGGLATSAITAGLVFVVGWPLLPRREPPPPAQVAAPVPPPPPPPAPPPVPATATDAAPEARAPGPAPVDATASEAARVAGPDARAVGAAADEAAPVPAKEDTAKKEEPPKNDKRQGEKKDESAAPAADARKAPSPETQADKDLAREAWRNNKPDVSVTGNRAAILIPLKGSAEAGDFKIIKKTRTVVITLPKAASLNTMRFYKLRREGFVALWIDQAEKNARAEDGTKLKIVLAGQVEPQVELRDDFVRVTVARPQARPAAPVEAPAGAGDATDGEKE